MLFSFASVFLFLVVGFIFLAITLVLSRLIQSKGQPGTDKYIPYECGETTVGTSRFQFNARYYVITLIFVIFDVEALFIVPWAIVFRNLGWFAYFEMMLFIAILVVGLAYAWEKGALEWL